MVTCNHGSKRIKRLFSFFFAFANAYHDRKKVLQWIEESMTFICRKCDIFRVTFIVDSIQPASTVIAEHPGRSRARVIARIISRFLRKA